MIKNIVLDIGNVLVDWNPKGAMRELGLSEEMVQKVAAATVETDFWNEADRGVLSPEEILEEFHKKSPELREEIDLFWNHVELSLRQFSYTKDWIHSMKEQGFHVYILSNYGDWTYQKTKEEALDFLGACGRRDSFLCCEADQAERGYLPDIIKPVWFNSGRVRVYR